jgi:hypothetical protein
MVRLTVGYDEIPGFPKVKPPKFRTYVYDFLNRANRWSGGTKPAVVGQQTELFKPFYEKPHEVWEKWYLENFGEKLKKAQELISEKLCKLKAAISSITDEEIRLFVNNLVILQTSRGLRIQRTGLIRIAEALSLSWSPAFTEDERRGIDGYIGGIPVSVKPSTYSRADPITSNEGIRAKIIRYKENKRKGTITYEFDEE